MGVSAAVAGASLIGGMMASSAASNAANTQSAAAMQAAQLQANTTAATNAQQLGIYNANVARQQPFVDTGTAANTALAQFMGTAPSTGGANYGAGAQAPTLAQMQTNMNPQYQFMLDQGNQGLSAGAAARGGLLTGQFAKDASNYNIGAAGQGLQQGYNNYVQNQSNIYNRLSGISNQGQSAAAGVGTMGTQTGANMANTSMTGVQQQNQLTTSAANSQAAGMIGGANAMTGALNNGINSAVTMNAQNQYMSALNGQNQGNTAYNGVIPVSNAAGTQSINTGLMSNPAFAPTY